MNTPTNDDIKRMVDEARAEHDRCGDTPTGLGELVSRAVLTLKLAHTTMLAGSFWRDVRVLALRAMWLCGLLAWEAGRRMVSTSYDAVTMGGTPLPGTHPTDPPTAAETPEAKATPDVEALLREAEMCERPLDGTAGAAYAVVYTLARNLATALRAERERAERARETAGLAYTRAFDLQEHLRAVLRTGWAESAMAPSVVQKARAFLDGQEDPMGPNRTRYAMHCAEMRARDAEAERDAARVACAAAREQTERATEDLAGSLSDLSAAMRAKDEAEKERGAALDMAAKYRAEALDLRAKLQEKEQRIEGLTKGIEHLYVRAGLPKGAA